MSPLSQRFLVILTIILSWSTLSTSIQAQEAPLSLVWKDLIPEQERTIFAQRIAQDLMSNINHDGDAPLQSSFGTMREDLNGKRVQIPGYVIPLEGDDKIATELLLVPYMGACIHVPPPPRNQIVYVTFEKGAPLNQLWEAVIIEGTLKIQTTQNELAEVGYLLEGIKVLPYSE